MKAGKEHRSPLCARAVSILDELHQESKEGFVFPSRHEGTALSNMAMLQLLRRMGLGDLTVHGFRSTFRDWAAEQTNYPREVAEMALAHTVSDKVEAAYRRGDLFEKRGRIMEDWAKYCNTPSAILGKVIPINKAAKST
jgi:integrase